MAPQLILRLARLQTQDLLHEIDAKIYILVIYPSLPQRESYFLQK